MSHWLLSVLAGLAVCQLGALLTTLYLHRALAHRALALAPPVAFVCRALTWIVTGIRPRQWVAVHRKHHAHTDVPGDPHSPILDGFATVQLGNVALYRRAARDPAVVARYGRDLPADRWDRALFDHAVVGLAIGIGILVAVLGVAGGLLAAAVHTVSYLLMSGAINAVGHAFGSRPHPNTSTNNQWLAWLSFGEGLHNNHPFAPTPAKLAPRRGEIDRAWPIVRFLVGRGWATARHEETRRKQPVAA